MNYAIKFLKAQMRFIKNATQCTIIDSRCFIVNYDTYFFLPTLKKKRAC